MTSDWPKITVLGEGEAQPNRQDVRHAQAMQWLKARAIEAQEYYQKGNVNNPLS